MKQDDFKDYSNNMLRHIRESLTKNTGGRIPEKLATYINTENPQIGNVQTRKNRCVALIDREIVSRFLTNQIK